MFGNQPAAARKELLLAFLLSTGDEPPVERRKADARCVLSLLVLKQGSAQASWAVASIVSTRRFADRSATCPARPSTIWLAKRSTWQSLARASSAAAPHAAWRKPDIG